MIEIKLTRLPHGEGLPLPQYATEHAAGMVIVEVRHDHEVDACRVLAHGAQRLDRLTALDTLDVAVLRVHVRPSAGLDEDPLPTCLDEQ